MDASLVGQEDMAPTHSTQPVTKNVPLAPFPPSVHLRAPLAPLAPSPLQHPPCALPVLPERSHRQINAFRALWERLPIPAVRFRVLIALPAAIPRKGERGCARSVPQVRRPSQQRPRAAREANTPFLDLLHAWTAARGAVISAKRPTSHTVWKYRNSCA